MTDTLTLDATPETVQFAAAKTALIVVDMQNAYCSPGGYMDRIGFDVTGSAPVIAETAALIAACKANGIQVIYLQNGFAPDLSDVGGPTAPVWHKSNALRHMRAHPETAGQLITRGGWDHEIVEELTPANGDLVVPKTRYSGFAGTNLDQILSSRRIETLLVCGVATNVCVESTIRDAYHREYFPIMVKDATMAAGGPALQAATEFNVERFLGWVTTGAQVRAAFGRNSGDA